MKVWTTAAVIVLTTTTVFGQETRPAEAADGPKAVMRQYAAALSHGDGKAMNDLLVAGTPTEQRMAAAITGYAECLMRLNEAMTAKFGKAATKEQLGDYADMESMMSKQIDTAAEHVDGDTATLKLGDDPQSTQYLKKVDGHWKISVAEMAKDAKPEDVERTITTTEKAIGAIAELTGQVKEGKFATALAAGEVMRSKLQSAGSPTAAPAGGVPTTLPTGK